MKLRRLIVNLLALVLIALPAYYFYSRNVASKLDTEFDNSIEKEFKDIDKAKPEELIKFINKKTHNSPYKFFIRTGKVKEGVVHSSYKNEYLYNDINGRYSYRGVTHLSYENQSIFDPVAIVFSHNLLDGKKFAPLVRYNDSFNELKLTTSDETIEYELVMAGVCTDDEIEQFFKSSNINDLKLNKVFFKSEKEDKHYLCLVTCYSLDARDKAIYVYKKR